jgi:5-methylcytosine-specific restriction protein B
MSINLASTQDIVAACTQALGKVASSESYHQWLSHLRAYLDEVITVEHERFVSPAFQEKLWNSETISATGMGSVDVSKVITSPEIAEHLWKLKNTPLSENTTERLKVLIEAWDKCLELMQSAVNRTPKLKMSRVFATLKPTEFTTVASESKLRELAKSMNIPNAKGMHIVELHRRVLDRLNEAIGNVEGDSSERMTLPWLLYGNLTQDHGSDATTVADAISGFEKLIPLPAARRRRGLLAIGGFLPSIRSMIELAKDGCTREDMKEHIKSINPNLAPTSVGTNLNALIAEWGVLRANGNSLELTPRGEALLETGDPAEVADWLLTKILGFDNALFALKTTPVPISVNHLVNILQDVNPGWTSAFAPGALINWIRALGLATLDQNKNLALTEEGVNWSNRIHWIPEKLPSTKPTEQIAGSSQVSLPDKVNCPPLDDLINAFPSTAKFDSTLIARLHAGLWLHERRHFAVLTGLSGAGKTLLARSYGEALWANSETPNKGLCTVPVQPGWHDPSSLLGYVNPLIDNTYVRTDFLGFLLRASSDPTRPYTMVLDEMNLSHPEQYLAPLLSAMETGDDILLHTFDDEISGIPSSIPYPNNLVLIGTVNMDETTHGLSDKVLDRASVIEFWDIDVQAYPAWEKFDLEDSTIQEIRQVLIALATALRPVRLHFGWRTIGDILGYVRMALSGNQLENKVALDHAIYAKVLPKLRGEDTPRLRKAFAEAAQGLKLAGLNESATKLNELADDLKYIGSARFWR